MTLSTRYFPRISVQTLKILVAPVVALMVAAGNSRAAEPAEFGALAFGESETGVVWAADFGDSWISAKTAAVNRCAGALGSSCRSWGVFPNRCVALAESECPADSCSKPAYGVSLGSTFSKAVAGAVAECESSASGAGVSETCRAPVNDEGEPGVVCVGIEAVGDPHDLVIHANAEWGALGFGESRTRAAWAFDFADSEAAAESAATDRCAGVLGRSCTSWGAFSDSCVALAVSDCPADSCSKPVYGVSLGSTFSEAVAGAVRSCEAYKDAALSRCAQHFGAPCSTYLSAFEDTCHAVAVSECLEGCVRPAHGVSGGSSLKEATTGAIAMCESNALSVGAPGICRVALSDEGERGAVCVGNADDGRPPTPVELVPATVRSVAAPAEEERVLRCQQAALMRVQGIEMGSYLKLDEWGFVGRVNLLIEGLTQGNTVTQLWDHTKDYAEHGVARMQASPSPGQSRTYAVLPPKPQWFLNRICGMRDEIEWMANELQSVYPHKRSFEWRMERAEEDMEEITSKLEEWEAGVPK